MSGDAAVADTGAAAMSRQAETALAQKLLRLALFSPLPPIPSGIAAYTADLLPLLPPRWSIDVFTDEGVDIDDETLRRGREQSAVCRAHTEFAARQAQQPYDLTVYQVGNTSQRTYMLEHVLTHPGLLVLHDGVLHPARVDAATRRGDMPAYRRLAERCREDAGAAIGHLVAGGLGGPALYSTYPMCEDLVRASLVTAMHGEHSCAWLRRVVPDAQVVELVHWRSASVQAQLRDTWRQRLAGAADVLIGSFGNIGAERRLDRVLRALAALPRDLPWRLVIAGTVDTHLGLDVLADELGIADRIAWHQGLDDADFAAVMGAVDAAVNLRYPPARASSGVLHQLLQLGVPVLISDVVHWRDYPDGVVVRIPPGPDEAEHDALCAALQQWVGDAGARAAAGRAAATWAAEHITAEAMRQSYLHAVAEAMLRSPA